MNKKSAIARLLSDFINADSIIDAGEIGALNRLYRKYNIDEQDRINAQSVQFSDAVTELMQMTFEQRRELIDSLKEMTMSDGKCVPQEAMLLMAVDYCLGVERPVKMDAMVLSAESLGVLFDRTKVIYVESRYNDALNEEIKQNLRYIESELKVIGMDFVYMPSVSEDFRNMSDDYLRKVIAYLSPGVKEEKRESIYESLCNITTYGFCEKLLARKLGLNVMRRIEPSLLVTLGVTTKPFVNEEDGSVVQKSYNQFLCLRIGDGVMNAVNAFVDRYKEIIDVLNTTLSFSSRNRIAYFGFHRSLFDMMLYSGRKQECTLLYDVKTGVLKFRELDEVVNLSRKVKAVYLAMLQQSMQNADRKMRLNERTLGVFREIYYDMGCDDTDDVSIDLTGALTRIRGELTKHTKVQNLDCFIPERGKNSVVTTNVDTTQVWIADGEEMLPMMDWRWGSLGKR